MASVFAIVSKAVFEEDFPSTQCGNVLAIDRYVSKHPSFAQMQKGDAIRDITAVMPKLVFSTGKGVGPFMTGLGMTLQTPRKLTGADVTLLRAAK